MDTDNTNILTYSVTFFFFFFFWFFKTEFFCVALAVLEHTLKTRLAFKNACLPSAGIKGMCHHWPAYSVTFNVHEKWQPQMYYFAECMVTKCLKHDRNLFPFISDVLYLLMPYKTFLWLTNKHLQIWIFINFPLYS